VRDAYLQRREMQVEERGPTRRLRGTEPDGEAPPADDFYEVEEFETGSAQPAGE
jgi:hypothetical protein